MPTTVDAQEETGPGVRSVNNYTRPEGQNVGNFMTDRSSSRVLAPPGGKSSVNFFGGTAPSQLVGVDDGARLGELPFESRESVVDTTREVDLLTLELGTSRPR